ncbi:MAG: hypothetical protein HC897_11900 [Thermoanaerobaculia bacterium]|nr:hypothetical protein [Thermoanaerobaculia bacterium]
MRGSRRRLAAVLLAAAGLLLTMGAQSHAQNTLGGDVFAPGEADFPQNGSVAGRGPGFNFSDDFYLANGLDPVEMRAQENGATAPSRFGAFYRGPGDAQTAPGPAPDDRFLDDSRIKIHNMGFNAAGEMLFYPDPPAFFFESAFLDQETKDLTNRSFVFLFPRAQQYVSTVMGCEGTTTAFDFLDPGPCNRRQDNIFDTGNGYLTSNPLQLWRIMFVTWDGPDVDTPACREYMGRLAERNGLDTDGTPNFNTVREILDVASGDVIAGQGANEVVLPGALPGAHGLPNPDPRGDIPGVEPEERGEVCVTVRTRRQDDGFGNPAQPDNPVTAENEALDGPPFVV